MTGRLLWVALALLPSCSSEANHTLTAAAQEWRALRSNGAVLTLTNKRVHDGDDGADTLPSPVSPTSRAAWRNTVALPSDAISEWDSKALSIYSCASLRDVPAYAPHPDIAALRAAPAFNGSVGVMFSVAGQMSFVQQEVLPAIEVRTTYGDATLVAMMMARRIRTTDGDS